MFWNFTWMCHDVGLLSFTMLCTQSALSIWKRKSALHGCWCVCANLLCRCVCVCVRAHKSALQVCVCVSVCVLGRLFRMLTFSQSSCFQACNPLLTSLVSVTLSPESLSELQWRISPFSLRFSFCVRLSCDLFPFSLSVLFLFLSSRNGSHYYVYCYLSYSLCHYEFIYFWSLYYNFESLERDRN